MNQKNDFKKMKGNNKKYNSAKLIINPLSKEKTIKIKINYAINSNLLKKAIKKNNIGKEKK